MRFAKLQRRQGFAASWGKHRLSRSALLKLDRADSHIAELDDFLVRERPFEMFVRTNLDTGQRTMVPRRNDDVAERVALIAGDAVHNIRAALDHAYGAIVSPLVTKPNELKKVQFPFSATAASLEDRIKARFADRVSARFFQEMVALAPHPEGGGNHLLHLVDQLDIPDKHRALIPTGDISKLGPDLIRREVPDFPMDTGAALFASGITFQWPMNRSIPMSLGFLIGPHLGTYEKKLDFPVGVVFQVAPPHLRKPAVELLKGLSHAAREAVKRMVRAST